MYKSLKIAILIFVVIIAFIFSRKIALTESITASSTPATSTIAVATSSKQKVSTSTKTIKKSSTGQISASTKEVYLYAVDISKMFYLDQEKFTKVMYCESGYNPLSNNTSDPYGGSKGAGQFLQKTFNHYKILAGRPNGDIWNYKDSLFVAGFMWGLDPSQEKQWSYYRILYGDLYYKYSEARISCDKKWDKFQNSLSK